MLLYISTPRPAAQYSPTNKNIAIKNPNIIVLSPFKVLVPPVGIEPTTSRQSSANPDYKSGALPIELQGLMVSYLYIDKYPQPLKYDQ